MDLIDWNQNKLKILHTTIGLVNGLTDFQKSRDTASTKLIWNKLEHFAMYKLDYS